MTENEIGTVVVEEAISLRRELGPGLLELLYEVCLADALERRGYRRRKASFSGRGTLLP